MKKSVIFFIATTFLVVLYSLWPQAPEVEPTVHLLIRAGESEYRDSIKSGALAAAREHHAVLNIVEADDGSMDGMDELALLIEQPKQALVAAGMDLEPLEQVLKKASGNRVPLVAVDSAIPVDGVDSLVCTNNLQACQMLGKAIIREMGGYGQLAIVGVSSGSISALERKQYLKSYLEGNSDIEVVPTEQFGDDCYMQSKKAMEDYKRLGCIVGLDGKSVTDAAKAIGEQKEDVLLFGFDCSLEQAELLEEDILTATAVQSPFAMGYLGVTNALRVIGGEEVSAVINTPVIIVYHSNMFAFANQKLVFPFE